MSNIGDIFHGRPRIKPDGTPHYPGQIYRPKKYKQKLFNADPTCKLCKKPIATLVEATLDHIIPRFHGGHTTKNNVQLAHKECNERKGHLLDEELEKKYKKRIY